MSQQRLSLWAADEIDEDLHDVDVSLAIGSYAQNGLYDDGAHPHPVLPSVVPDPPQAQSRINEATLIAVQQQMAQQAAFSQIPDVVKRVSLSPLSVPPRPVVTAAISSSCTSTKLS